MSSGSVTAIGLALALGVLVAMVSVPVSAVVVNFPDPGLEVAIREAIGEPTGDIHDTDLIGLTSLDPSDREIANLEGVQHCADLTVLDLDSNQISNISALSGLSDLVLLELQNNQISDISALSGLTNLTRLSLFSNQISNISPLVNNPGIDNGDDVDLRYNSLDLTPGFPDRLDLETLQDRGVDVDFDPQN